MLLILIASKSIHRLDAQILQQSRSSFLCWTQLLKGIDDAVRRAKSHGAKFERGAEGGTKGQRHSFGVNAGLNVAVECARHMRARTHNDAE